MENNSLPLQIHSVQVSDLNPAPYNPRLWDSAAIAQLKESITSFGLVDPLIVNGAENRKNIVIGGHFRLFVAKELGFTEVPVVYVTIPELEREKELNLRLNKNQGSWDLELLRNFDVGILTDIGFSDTDLSGIWDSQLETEDDHFDVEKELAEITEPVVKLGELYQLGNHRLICGNSEDPEVLKKLMAGKKASMLQTDPPYNIALSYTDGISTKGKYGGEKTKDNRSQDEYRKFLTNVLQIALANMNADAHVFMWCDQNYIGLIQSLFTENKVIPKRVLTWIKNNINMTPKIAFNKATESCVYGIIGSPYLSDIKNLNEVMNKEVGTGNRTISDILDLLDIWLVSRLPTADYEHPTEKPPTLHEKPLRRCSKPGDIILDCFGGSGSTLIACEQLNRTAYLVEIEPIFCDLIIRRFEKLTNTHAVRIN